LKGYYTLVQLSKNCNMTVTQTRTPHQSGPSLENYTPATSPYSRGADPRGGEWALDEVTELGALRARRAALGLSLADRNQRSCAPTTATATVSMRSVRPAYHELMKVAGRPRACMPRRGQTTAPAQSSAPPRPRCGRLSPVPYLPDLDDVCRRACAAHNLRTGRHLRAAAASREYDPELKLPTPSPASPPHVDDREAKVVRCPPPPPKRRGTPTAPTASPPQVVHLAPMCDVFLVCPGAGRTELLSSCRESFPTEPQSDVPAAAQGQAGNTPTPPVRRVRRRHRVVVGEEGRGVPTIIEMFNLTRRTARWAAHQHAQRADPCHSPRAAPKGVGDYLRQP